MVVSISPDNLDRLGFQDLTAPIRNFRSSGSERRKDVAERSVEEPHESQGMPVSLHADSTAFMSSCEALAGE
jgi:hypothetical protein